MASCSGNTVSLPHLNNLTRAPPTQHPGNPGGAIDSSSGLGSHFSTGSSLSLVPHSMSTFTLGATCLVIYTL